MNIIDTNGISHIFTNNLLLRENYYLAPDVAEEVEMTQLVHGKKLPSKISLIDQVGNFNQSIYLDHYKKTLNKYGGRSFYNMTGFGDVSIISVLHMFMDIFERQGSEQLFDTSEKITVYTNDARLTANINTEFSGKDIRVLPITDIS